MADGTSPDEQALFAAVHDIFSERIPFNKLLGIHIDSMSFESARIRLDYREELVGNFLRGSLHGGVVSAMLDLTGGLVAFLSAAKNAAGSSHQEKLERLANVGTIDIRVDYLRPGIGRHFLASAYLLRSGNKVAVTRMELHNEEQSLIAVGTGAYLVG
jgi:uncharacterized protein (TIGR00369 family)